MSALYISDIIVTLEGLEAISNANSKMIGRDCPCLSRCVNNECAEDVTLSPVKHKYGWLILMRPLHPFKRLGLGKIVGDNP